MPPDTTKEAKEIVAAHEWEGDIRVNMTTVIGAGRVLSRRVSELERIIVEYRREFRSSGGDISKLTFWGGALFRVEIDENQYTE